VAKLNNFILLKTTNGSTMQIKLILVFSKPHFENVYIVESAMCIPGERMSHQWLFFIVGSVFNQNKPV
jgi:hypothetical protein